MLQKSALSELPYDAEVSQQELNSTPVADMGSDDVLEKSASGIRSQPAIAGLPAAVPGYKGM